MMMQVVDLHAMTQLLLTGAASTVSCTGDDKPCLSSLDRSGRLACKAGKITSINFVRLILLDPSGATSEKNNATAASFVSVLHPSPNALKKVHAIAKRRSAMSTVP